MPYASNEVRVAAKARKAAEAKLAESSPEASQPEPENGKLATSLPKAGQSSPKARQKAKLAKAKLAKSSPENHNKARQKAEARQPAKAKLTESLPEANLAGSSPEARQAEPAVQQATGSGQPKPSKESYASLAAYYHTQKRKLVNRILDLEEENHRLRVKCGER